MNYSQAIKYLDSFINYEKTPPRSHAELNLARMRHGLEVLNHPENNFFPILIAGTVGKGSTGYFLEQILKSSGISCGYYHSPHVDDIRERIRVHGDMLSEKKWASALTDIQNKLKKNPFPKKMGKPTYFEMMTLLAIELFGREGLRIGIFEIGMGGRLDATNVLDAPLCLLTKIDFDHQAFLGNTLAKIAAEKAGIIKQARFVVSAPQEKSAMNVIRRIAAKQNSRLISARPLGFQPALSGLFQKENAGNAVAAARLLRDQFDFGIKESAIRAGLRQKKWPARFELARAKKMNLILDAAHNPAGCRELVRAFTRVKKKPAAILFSALRDKESTVMLKILASFRVPLIIVPIHHARAKSPSDLAAEAEAFFDRIILAKNMKQGFELLKKQIRAGQTAVITGSFYLLCEARQILGIK